MNTFEPEAGPVSTDTKTAAGTLRSALVIDDDEIYRELSRAILEELGWSVETAWNGQVGWQMAQLYDYDLILCDIIMPYQDGFETIRRLRTYRPALPIIAMSGGGILYSDVYARMACWFGADTSLSKPFGIHDLREAIDRMRHKLRPDTSEALQVFDRDAFAYFADSVTPATLHKLAGRLENEIDDRLAAMRIAVALLNHGSVREHAHALKSSAALFGLARLSSASATLEKLAVEEDERGEDAMLKVLDKAAKDGWLDLQAALGQRLPAVD